MSFRCDICKNTHPQPSAPATYEDGKKIQPMTARTPVRVVTATKTVHHPGHTVYGPFGSRHDVPGGVGTQIVKEANMCRTCADAFANTGGPVHLGSEHAWESKS